MNKDDISLIYQRALRIFEGQNITWEEKYDLIFSDDISRKVRFDYYDPDTNEQEDVTAFMEGFKRHMEELGLSTARAWPNTNTLSLERFRAKARLLDIEILEKIQSLLALHDGTYVLPRGLEFFHEGNEVGDFASHITNKGLMDRDGSAIVEFSSEAMGFQTKNLLMILDLIENRK